VFVYYDWFTRGGECLCLVSHLSQETCVISDKKEEDTKHAKIKHEIRNNNKKKKDNNLGMYESSERTD